MKKKLSLLICTVFLISTYTVYANEEMPTVDAAAAILMDYQTGRVLWSKNPNMPLANASTTKIMTAVLTLENGNLDDTVTVSRRASLAPEVNMNLREGEEIKLEYLLYALMLQSSNDAAVAIAEHVGGSVENFCTMMTERAKELGALDSVFVTPNGLDSGDHHSTAYDLAVITRHALSMPEFVKITNTSEITAPSSKTSHYISNKNRLLQEYEGANGVKTGFTGKAGHCFVGAAKQSEMQLISVVLASGWGNKGKEQKWIDTKEILNYGFKNFSYKQVVEAGDPAGHINLERSKTPAVSFHYADSLFLPLTDAEVSQIKIIDEYPDSLRAPVEKNQWVGVAKVYLDDTLYKEIDLRTSVSASRHDLKTSLEKVLKNFLEMGTNEEIKVTLPEF